MLFSGKMALASIKSFLFLPLQQEMEVPITLRLTLSSPIFLFVLSHSFIF